MRHVVFERPGVLAWREAPDPRIEGGLEALVRPIVVGRCDLDVAFSKGLVPIPSGAPIGHEIIAEVIEIGDQVRNLRIGETVFVPAQISCGACVNCRRGLTGRCQSVPFAASYGMGREGGFGGGLADIVRVPFADAMLTVLPPHVDPVSMIGLADMATDAWRAVAPHLDEHPGARVLVLGGMPAVIGLYSAGLAHALGAACVDYVDTDPRRRETAARFGAQTHSSIDGGAYDLIVVANPSKAALGRAFELAAAGATITSVAPAIDGTPEIDARSLYHRGITWRIGRPDCRHGRDGALSAWANRGFRPSLAPTLRVPWDDAPEAWLSDEIYVAAVKS